MISQLQPEATLIRATPAPPRRLERVCRVSQPLVNLSRVCIYSTHVCREFRTGVLVSQAHRGESSPRSSPSQRGQGGDCQTPDIIPLAQTKLCYLVSGNFYNPAAVGLSRAGGLKISCGSVQGQGRGMAFRFVISEQFLTTF